VSIRKTVGITIKLERRITVGIKITVEIKITE
jgi:hypothetical protein